MVAASLIATVFNYDVAKFASAGTDSTPDVGSPGFLFEGHERLEEEAYLQGQLADGCSV